MGKSKKGLGRGLSALLGDSVATAAAPQTISMVENSQNYIELALTDLRVGQYQPRRFFTEESLRELAESISAKGVMQPIVVRQVSGIPRYEIIAGERRWRASKIAGKTTIPAVIKDLNDKEALAFGLVENIQRENLTPLEEAEGYKRLMSEFNYTQETIASYVNKSRSHVANLLRLLNLPDEIKPLINSGKLSMGHARALLKAKDSKALALEAVEKGLSVRQIEQRIKQEQEGIEIEADAPIGKASAASPSPAKSGRKKKKGASQVGGAEEIDSLVEYIEKALNMSASIESNGNNSGSVVIEYNNLVELDTIVKRLCAQTTGW